MDFLTARRRMHRRVTVLCTAALLAALATLLPAQEDDDEFPEVLPGLVARYTVTDEEPRELSRTRVDDLLSFIWNDTSPHPALPPGDFDVQWSGRLFSIQRGKYRLHLYAAGGVELSLSGKVLIEGSSKQPQWFSSEPLELSYGYHPLEVALHKTSEEVQIKLYWEGPKFGLEPTPARHLFHDRAQTIDGRFERGRLLAHALRCTACHDIPGHESPLPAPSLKTITGAVSRDWLSHWIQHAGHDDQAEPPERSLKSRMPAFGLDQIQADAVASYLLATSKPPELQDFPPPAPKKKPKLKKDEKPHVPSTSSGRRLFLSLGCLACHRVGELGNQGLFAGGDLTRIAEKRPPQFFYTWLAGPAALNRKHRMPLFRLSTEQRHDLTLYLSTLHGESSPTDAAFQPAKAAEEAIPLGRQLVGKLRCAACHELPGQEQPRQEKLTIQGKWSAGCVGSADVKKSQPGFELSEANRQALESYVSQLSATPRTANQPARDGALVLAERNCLGCHARSHQAGIAGELDGVMAALPELAARLPALKPPALFGVGDKLHEEALHSAIAVKNAPLRPWLDVRMPKFDLAEDEMQAVIAHLVDTDHIPQRAEPAPRYEDEAAMKVAGRRLVTSSGFGCTSCHQIGQTQPAKVELKSRGTDLSLLGRRIRRSWYDRWMPNPARIVPRMEMPALVQPIHGVLDDELPHQLAAVWRVLNEPGFNPPPPNPIRVVRAHNIADQHETAHVLTDVMEVRDEAYIKPLVVGLENRHSLLLDLDVNQLRGWWMGDVARQRTRGKFWYWEPGGTHLLHAQERQSDMRLLMGGEAISPQRQGQFITEFDELRHVNDGVQVQHRLRFASENHELLTLRITQQFTPLSGDVLPTAGVANGFRRRVQVQGLPSGASLVVQLLPGSSKPVPGQSRLFQSTSGPAGCYCRVADSSGQVQASPQPLVVITGDGQSPAACTIDYLTTLPTDRFLVPSKPDPVATLQQLDVAPGFQTTRLPLPTHIMPTALTWREDGVLVFASLKGRVWLAQDSDGDELEDRITQFSDELAAPYGLAARDGAIDVLNKYALLRLHDEGGDQRAERTETLASGWGHTRDYHDWVVGLPQDEQGSYFVAVPCQQDDRQRAAAHLRGRLLRLVSRTPSLEDPRKFGIEEVCAGLRFPMGLARNSSGEIFATDNQGNYNPFNELNHLQAGRHYGFINKLEFKPGERPPLTPPSVNLPHPWTRSVNGLCFLATPPQVREKLGRDLFGPFEGHLVGCEYNNRQLIRMSLDRVGEQIQGAAYPLTLNPEGGAELLQGPVVCQIAPDGDLYVGDIRDSAWGGGNDTGQLIRMRPQGRLPIGIAEIRARPEGFVIDFTGPVDEKLAGRTDSYAISQYQRISTPAYGGTDKDRSRVAIRSLKLSADRRRVVLTLPKLQANFVYEFQLKNLAGGDELFHPGEAHYTLNVIPNGE